jgi:hypothetical protein
MNVNRMESSTTTPHPDPAVREYARIYSLPGRSFVQVQYCKQTLVNVISHFMLTHFKQGTCYG